MERSGAAHLEAVRWQKIEMKGFLNLLEALSTLVCGLTWLFPYPFLGFVFSLPAIFALLMKRINLSFNRILIIGLVASTLAFITSAIITSRISSYYLFPAVPAMEGYQYRDKIYDIQYEAWLRSIVPPPLQKDCFSIDYEVCKAFEDGSMMMKEFDKSWSLYINEHLEDTISFVVCIVIIGGVSFLMTRRKSAI